MANLILRRPRTHLVIPDPHSHPEHSNERADWLAQLMVDLKPDVVVNIGDQADMSSLSSYDKGKREYHGRKYRDDINASVEFSDRLWSPYKKLKKRLPQSYFFEGNHEQRIERALDLSPELEGAIGFDDFQHKQYYDEIIRYSGGSPGVREIDGVSYAHYFITGISGRPIGGEHPAYTLLVKQFTSATQGHAHTLDMAERARPDGSRLMTMICGCYQDYDSAWAGRELCNMWWRGVVVKRNVENGRYDPQFISLDTLRSEYSRNRDVPVRGMAGYSQDADEDVDAEAVELDA